MIWMLFSVDAFNRAYSAPLPVAIRAAPWSICFMATAPDRTHTMAVFCDFENLAIGVREAKYDKFEMSRVLERLLLKGSIVVKKAYCDWERYKDFKKNMHEAAFELIEIPHVRQSGKNSADIRMVVDALDLCYTKAHVDTFVVVSGDSDFSPLVSKLRENNKKVIGVGVKNSTSDIFIGNCDEFIFYDDLVREKQKGEGGMPICFKFAKMCWSMKFFNGGSESTGAPSGMETLHTLTLPPKRTMTATLPGRSSVFTRPLSDAEAMAVSLASKSASFVTSRLLPSE